MHRSAIRVIFIRLVKALVIITSVSAAVAVGCKKVDTGGFQVSSVDAQNSYQSSLAFEAANMDEERAEDQPFRNWQLGEKGIRHKEAVKKFGHGKNQVKIAIIDTNIDAKKVELAKSLSTDRFGDKSGIGYNFLPKEKFKIKFDNGDERIVIGHYDTTEQTRENERQGNLSNAQNLEKELNEKHKKCLQETGENKDQCLDDEKTLINQLILSSSQHGDAYDGKKLNFEKDTWGSAGSSVQNPQEDHGTFVAGLIISRPAANDGIEGVCPSCTLIPFGAIPHAGGDERDENVALAIRYAVDQGARVINMSAGKPISPNKAEVQKAIDYAAAKDVLLITTAGNRGTDNDVAPQYPHRSKTQDHWIIVGSYDPPEGGSGSETWKRSSFSSYGKNTVDLFAPGARISSLKPLKDTYVHGNGTSFAAPLVAGSAAFILSHYPEMKARDLKRIILAAVRKSGFDCNIKGTQPTGCSQTDGVMDLVGAMELAAKEFGGRSRGN
jgi:subtilisin family serine protease